MFTGIIEEVGTIAEISDRGEFRTIRVRARVVLEDAGIGSSIAVNGVCLTVVSTVVSTAVSSNDKEFTADLSHETLERTSLKVLTAGSPVNLERPMRADGRFGGHIVQGHVDGLGRIVSFDRDGDSWTLKVECSGAAAQYIVEKGSIAVDGISLTVAAVKGNVFDVAIIPHTFENTNLGKAHAGDPVNLEFDIVAKYVEKMLSR
jgi:riboflavin synthase